MATIEEIDFDLIRGGIEDLLRVVPRVPAVYAWFRKFLPPDPDKVSAKEFAEYLEAEVEQPHMAPRNAKLAPIYRISLTSDRQFSSGKQNDLIDLCSSLNFRREIAVILREHASIFSQPLYIGRATNLRERVEQHFSGDSGLKDSLEGTGVDILRCKILYINFASVVGDLDVNQTTLGVVEELLSKLFCPPFTKRYG